MPLVSAEGLCAFVDASPSPFHARETAADVLRGAGFSHVDERDPWPTGPGRWFLVRGGSLVAWSTLGEREAHDPFRVVAGHTDSPNLRVKPHHDLTFEGVSVLALEPYGGPLLESWMDRDLRLAGRLVLRDGTELLVDTVETALRVPRLAIHLTPRDGYPVDVQRHLNGLRGLGVGPLLPWLAEREGIAADEIAGFDLMTADVLASAQTAGGLVAAPRLDNQATCYAATAAFAAAEPVEGLRQMLVLFDHEEVGSGSERGAQSDIAATALERIVLAAGGGREELHRAVADSMCLSADMAHATHPNHPDRHEPAHHIRLGGGPVLKVNQNLRYATDGRGTAAVALAAEQAGVPLQRFVNRADLPCGSTIGPAFAIRTGMATVDIGAPQLAMHSARETMAAADVPMYGALIGAFVAPRFLKP